MDDKNNNKKLEELKSTLNSKPNYFDTQDFQTPLNTPSAKGVGKLTFDLNNLNFGKIKQREDSDEEENTDNNKDKDKNILNTNFDSKAFQYSTNDFNYESKIDHKDKPKAGLGAIKDLIDNAKNDKIELVKSFFNNYTADLNIEINKDEFIFHEIIKKCKSVEVIDFLINNGADVNAKGVNNKTPLFELVNSNDDRDYGKILDLFKSHYADFLYKINDVETLLHTAANSKCKDAIQWLVNNGFYNEDKDQNNETAKDIWSRNNISIDISK